MYPDILGSFSDEEWKKIIAWLNDKNISMACPACKAVAVSPARTRYVVNMISPASELLQKNVSTTAIGLVCANCLHLDLFLYPGPEPIYRQPPE
jgi:hypothetical protein